MRASVPLTPADVEYITAGFVTLEALCTLRAEKPEDIRALIGDGRLPRPAYVLRDGTEMFPPDYFSLDADGPLDPTVRLLFEIVEEHRVHRAFKADVQFCHLVL